jgi:hypothetical protein
LEADALQQSDWVANLPRGTAASSGRNRHGVYGVLLRDGSAMSRETLAVIDGFVFDRSPRLLAYSSRILAMLPLMILAVFLYRLPPTDPASWIAGAYQLEPTLIQPLRSLIDDLKGLCILAAVISTALTFFDVKAKRYVSARGRLQIRTGIFHRRVINIELWRVQDIELDRTLLNQITRDGTLAFHVIADRGNRVVKVTGLAHGRQLEEYFQAFLNLVFLLRSNPAVKGIIY